MGTEENPLVMNESEEKGAERIETETKAEESQSMESADIVFGQPESSSTPVKQKISKTKSTPSESSDTNRIQIGVNKTPVKNVPKQSSTDDKQKRDRPESEKKLDEVKNTPRRSGRKVDQIERLSYGHESNKGMKAKKSSSNDHSMIETDSCGVLWEKIENKMYSFFEHKRIKYKGDDTSAAYCFSIKRGGQIQFKAISPNLVEEETRKDEHVTLDGHTSSVEAATRAAQANITLENQIHQIHKVKELLPDAEKEKIVPKPVAEAPNTSKLPTSVSAVPMPAQPQQPVQPQVEPFEVKDSRRDQFTTGQTEGMFYC